MGRSPLGRMYLACGLARSCSLRFPSPDSWFSTGLSSRTYFLGSLGGGYPRETQAVLTCLGPCQYWALKMQCHLTKQELVLAIMRGCPTRRYANRFCAGEGICKLMQEWHGAWVTRRGHTPWASGTNTNSSLQGVEVMGPIP